jgi:dTDP-4-dehydrorhamnose reductase
LNTNLDQAQLVSRMPLPASAKLLIVGREGQVAHALRARFPEALVAARPQIDLARPETVAALIRRHRPTLVVNAAAHTAVDRAEDEPDLAHALNATAPGVIAAATADVGATIVHFSTDYVFDGAKATPYVETDPTGPLGVYGASKLAGEGAVAAANPRHVILRTSWVAGPHGANFVKTMLRLAHTTQSTAGKPMRVVADQHGAPTFAVDLGQAVAVIAERMHGSSDAPTEDPFGVFHLTGRGETTWAGFAAAIMAGAAARGAPSLAVEPIPTSAYPTRARRPANSRLSCAKIDRVWGVALPAWETSLAGCLDVLLGPA